MMPYCIHDVYTLMLLPCIVVVDGKPSEAYVITSIASGWQMLLPLCDEEYIGESSRTFGERF